MSPAAIDAARAEGLRRIFFGQRESFARARRRWAYPHGRGTVRLRAGGGSMIQLFRPSLGEEEAAAVCDTLAGGWVGLGPRTAAFEDAFARYVGARHCVAMNSGSAALHLAMLVLRLPPEAEVVVPALTFVSTAHAVSLAGARIVFADVDPHTLTLDPADLERRLSPRTRAVVPVHYGGHPCPMDEIGALAATAGAVVVEDAAHAAGASHRGRKVGTLSPLTCFSFQGGPAVRRARSTTRSRSSASSIK
jgi:perosamine synthetase